VNVLVTGASGFVGSHLATYLLACGDRVTGTYAGARPELPGVDLEPVDIVDRREMARLLARVEPEAVIHLAGLSHVGASWRQPADYFRVNVLGTEGLVEEAAGRRVVTASSAEVYGVVPEAEQPIAEDRPLAPASPYAMTKAAAERLAVVRGAVVARAFNLIGPGQSARFALPAFARQLAAIALGRQEPVLSVGNLAPRRDFLHVADGVRAYRLLALSGEPGTAYNIASGRALSIGEVLQRLQAIAGIEARVETDRERLRPTDLPLLAGDPGRLVALGWRPERTVDEALAELWESVREEGPGGG
jgi:GDP-4-dehydro-6-deoxy-D-mannose reductase